MIQEVAQKNKVKSGFIQPTPAQLCAMLQTLPNNNTLAVQGVTKVFGLNASNCPEMFDLPADIKLVSFANSFYDDATNTLNLIAKLSNGATVVMPIPWLDVIGQWAVLMTHLADNGTSIQMHNSSVIKYTSPDSSVYIETNSITGEVRFGVASICIQLQALPNKGNIVLPTDLIPTIKGDACELKTLPADVLTTYTDTTTAPKHKIGEYKNELGAITTVNETVSTLVDNVPAGTFTHTNEDGVVTTVDYNNETTTTITNAVAGHKIADYTNELAVVTPINETVTTVTAVQAIGKTIANHTNENGLSVQIKETVTTLANNNNGTYTHTSENGTVTNVSTLETVSYRANSLTFPANPLSGDEMFVTDNGTSTGVVKEQWIFNGTTWTKRPSTPVFDATVDFNTANPNTGGTVFTPNTPALTTVLYVSAVDGTQWTYNGTTYVPEPQIDLYRDRGMPNTLMTLSGVATFSRTNFLNWTSKFFILGGGRGAGTLSTAGFYEIGMPSVGTVIQGVGGIPNQTVNASGIDMRASAGSWSVLYYILNAGGQATVNANFRLAGWQSDFVVPNNWVMVGAYNADNLTVKLGNGQILKQGTDTNGLITPFDATIDFSVNTDPNTAGTTFSPNTPANSNVLYISTLNGSQWTYNGTAYVAAPASADWTTTGNSGTVQATNFIGTRDNTGLSFRTNNQIRQTITNTGNVGIGTTTPTNRLHVPNSGFNPTGNDLASIKVEGSYGGGIAFAEGANRSLIWSDSGRSLGFSTGGTVTGTPERMRILFNGNVGINTVGPSEKLEVGGNIRVTGIPNFANAAAALASGLLSGVFYTITVGGVKQLHVR